MFTNRVVSKLSAKRTLIIATVINGIHFLIFGLSQAPWMIYIGSFLGGAVLAFGSNVVCSSIISNWFIEKRASIIGLVFGGAGFGSAFSMFIAGHLIASVGWRTTYFIFTATLMVIGCGVAILFIKDNPEAWGKNR